MRCEKMARVYKKNFQTRAIHEGYAPGPTSPSSSVPIQRTSSYVFTDTRHASDLFALKADGHIYTRMSNPTTQSLEERLASLEGDGSGAGALALCSGTTAVFYSIINLAKQGDHIVSSTDLYGGTATQFAGMLPDFGITASFANPADPDNFSKAITKKTKALFCEAIGNPTLSVPDFGALAEVAHENSIPLIIDSTFATPYLLLPFNYGTDIVVHSLSKWIGGHGTGIGGAVVDSGNFDWKQSGKHPQFTAPDDNYHGIRYAYDFGKANRLAYINRMRLGALRNLGGCIAPDNSWIFLQGLETLSLRMERHCENALKVAKFLESNDAVSWVRYPGLSSHPSHGNAKKYFKKGFGGVVAFGVKGKGAGGKFIENLSLFSHLANVGDAKSLAIHPASTTHSQLTAKQLAECGISPDLVRLSIGLEDAEDIIADLEQALKVAPAGT